MFTRPTSRPPWLGVGNLKGWLAERYRAWLTERRWRALRSLGMRIGVNVNLPRSVWIDTSHCHLISIGDHCGFGDGVCILAHDALANEFLDATRVGQVTIRESCHIGARTVILPGVEIGPRAIVGANSVVTRSIPADSVAAGNPAKVLCTLTEYLARHRARLERAPRFPYHESDIRSMSETAKARMRALLAEGDGYIVGGYAAQLEGNTDQRVTAKPV
ncbi:MAG: acyltransferase [Deltaproteobacteria bacterium]|nr:acyltransferase [Deltaproteobacteria bacterium]